MFEAVEDAELVEVMGEATRDESAAVAQRLLAVGELYARRAVELSETFWWRSDPTDEVAAEVSAAQNISHAGAVGQIHYGRTLRERLPRLARVFARGVIDFRMVSTIIARTDNVDDAIISDLDEAVARHAEKWMKLSGPKLRDRVDLWVAKFDPAAVRVPPQVEDSRYIEIVPTDVGMAGIFGNVHAADGAALDKRLEALAATVCANDPRTQQQRKADAAGPLARGEDRLACHCGSDQCLGAVERNAAATAVIHVLAEQTTLDGSGDTPGYLPGFGILPAESVRELAKTATLKPVTLPTAVAPDPGYRPSALTKEFVRWRDLTCRWPGCDRPVDRCDVDHTVPWPYGPTHPSNNKPYCRTHHLIKTFCAGWTDQQLPDGTIILTAPTGHTYTTTPHGASMFPALGRHTGELDIPPCAMPPDTDRSAMMPRRKQTRDQDRHDRINAERRQRTELIAAEERQRQAWLAANYEPPPF